MYYKCRAVDIYLKNHMVYVFQNAYLSTLNNAYIGYATKSTLVILAHLHSKYACISTTDMVANNERLRLPYKERLNECADFSAAEGGLVTETHIISIVYGLVSETVQYLEYFRVWISINEKICTAFQAHFIEAQANLRE